MMSDFFGFKKFEAVEDADDISDALLFEVEDEPVAVDVVDEGPVVTTSTSSTTVSENVELVRGNPLGTKAEIDSVLLLQELLNGKGEQLVVDGVFGPQTNAAVRRLQRRNKLIVNGVVDDDMWSVLWA
jgi:peptidoglycan hydrolase-like protein with peptidoglycan-binding domain